MMWSHVDAIVCIVFCVEVKCRWLLGLVNSTQTLREVKELLGSQKPCQSDTGRCMVV